MKNKFFSYAGNKQALTETFNKKIRNFNLKIYIEPFVGSGAIYFNLEKEFDLYILNDIDSNVIGLYKALFKYNYKDYVDVYNYIFDKFGNIKNNKESYYSFRNWYNKKYNFSNNTEKYIFLYFLANSCINSIFRFGPNGFNQSFGHRLYFFNEETFNSLKAKSKRTVLRNISYDNVIKENSLIYLDPPYKSGLITYGNKQEKKFLKIIKNYNAEIFYSDYLNRKIIKKLGINWKFILTKNSRNISPNRKTETIKQEALYFNKRK